MTAKRIAIIGAGPAGLVSAKEALAEGMTPVVFERQAGIGGLWNLDSGAMWDSLHTNLSRHTCMFSDMPWPEDAEDFPSHVAVRDYLERYVDAFALRPHIRPNTTVTDITQAGEGWRVELHGKQGRQRSEYFAAVIDASGYFSAADRPETGLYKGRALHTRDYKRPEEFFGRHVDVIGNSFSGTEVAADIASHAASVTHILRRPGWIGPRYLSPSPGTQPKPLDLIFYRRADHEQGKTIDPAERRRVGRDFLRQACGDPGLAHPALTVDLPENEPVYLSISDTYLDRVRGGAIDVRRAGFADMTPTGILLDNGNRRDTDVVIFATGFRLALPFRNAALRGAIAYDPADKLQPLILHESTFHPEAPNLAFVGLYKGPYFGTMELQARWASAVFSGRVAPPARAVAEAGLDSERAIRAARPRPQFPRDYIGFSDRIAAAIGAMPDLATQDALAQKIWNGPFSPAHYRLNGTGAKPALARAIIEALPD